MTVLRHAALPLLALILVACAPGADEGGTSPTAAESSGATDAGPPPCPDTISIRDFAFEPASCAVAVGSTITFVNDDEVPHTATAEDGAASAFDTGTLRPGASATVTLDAVGSSPYVCEIHPSMRAAIEVVASPRDGGASDTSGDGGAVASEDGDAVY